MGSDCAGRRQLRWTCADPLVGNPFASPFESDDEIEFRITCDDRVQAWKAGTLLHTFSQTVSSDMRLALFYNHWNQNAAVRDVEVMVGNCQVIPPTSGLAAAIRIHDVRGGCEMPRCGSHRFRSKRLHRGHVLFFVHQIL